MQILLTDLLKEVTATTEDSPLKVQIYCDMDGVLVDMEKGFREMSGGLNPKEFEAKNGKGSFWKLIGRKKDFWSTLHPMPDAMVLWKFLTDNFKNPVPVVLSAGQGSTVIQQKTEWIHKHISPGIKVMIAPAGRDKPNFIINHKESNNEYITHVLIDDTQKNVDIWNDETHHRIAILHTDAGSTIKALGPFITR